MKVNRAMRDGYINPIPTTDLIIEYSDGKKEGIILITRKNYPYGIAIPGGFAEHGLSLEDNARKEAKEETNLDIILYDPERPFCVHSNPDRDPRDHIIGIVFVARGYGKLQAGDDAAGAKLYSRDEVRDLLGKNKIAFDHERALEKYLLKSEKILFSMPKYFQNESEKIEYLKRMWNE